MPDLTIPNTFSNTPPATNPIDADQVNANFAAVKTLIENLEGDNLAAAAEIAGTKFASSFLDKVGVSGTSTVRRGKTNIPTEEARTNVAYGTLATPDQVASVALPTDGLIVVGYSALCKCSVSGAGRAAIFVGANQYKARIASPAIDGAAPVTMAALIDGTDNYRAIGTAGSLGVVGNTEANSTSDVTTGQGVGVIGSAASALGVEAGGVGVGTTDFTGPGGPTYIFAAAGTYTVSVQFKASSGSVTAKERKLWVWTLGF